MVLVDNIGTYAKEDKAYELLNSLSIALPLVVIITAVFDALLAVVYLMWFHPWKIILQEERMILFSLSFIHLYNAF